MSSKADLSSVVHHIELNKSGWKDEAIDQIVMFIIWLKNGVEDENQVSSIILEEFGVDIPVHEIGDSIDRLTSSGKALIISGNLALKESELENLEEDIAAYNELEDESRRYFVSLADNSGLDVDLEKFWKQFHDELLVPLIHELGAKTYRLITQSDIEISSEDLVDKFIKSFNGVSRKKIRKVIVDFLDPEDQRVRQYILRQLHTYYFIESGNLSPDTLASLEGDPSDAFEVNVFIDTNYLISILGLSDSQDSMVHSELVELEEKISGKVNLNLYVTKKTIEETQATLSNYCDKLGEINFSRNIRNVLRRTDMWDNITRRFVEEFEKADQPIKAADYFEPYIHDTVTMIRENGLSFFNDDLSDLLRIHEVEEAIEDQHAYLVDKYGEDGAKPRKAVEHDVALWYHVTRRRPDHIESPSDVHDWITTLDYNFMGFDEYSRDKSDNIPVTILPGTLVQFLQFWVPRTQEYEKAVVKTLRMPLLIQSFEKTQSTTHGILRALSRFEECEDLPEDTVASLMRNQALRQKINRSEDVEEQVELVREEMIQRHKETVEKLSKTRGELEEKDEDLNRAYDRIKQLEGEQEKIEGELQRQTRIAEDARENKKKVSESKDRRIEKLEFCLYHVTVPISIVIIMSILVSALVSSIGYLSFIKTSIIVFPLSFIYPIYHFSRKGKEIDRIRENIFFQYFQSLKVYVTVFFIILPLVQIIIVLTQDFNLTLSNFVW